MKNLCLFRHFGSICIIASLLFLTACPIPPGPEEPEGIIGHIGNPQFNLQFTNGDKVDLDLYVQTPNGTVISYSNRFGQGGQLDVDCLCGNCPNGPNENIYWEVGSAPSGTYRFWVEYYQSCDGLENRSDYTLRVINNGTVIQTYSGTLSPVNLKSALYSINY